MARCRVALWQPDLNVDASAEGRGTTGWGYDMHVVAFTHAILHGGARGSLRVYVGYTEYCIHHELGFSDPEPSERASNLAA